MVIRKLINDFINRITRRPQSVMLQFGSRRSYLLKENGEIIANKEIMEKIKQLVGEVK